MPYTVEIFEMREEVVEYWIHACAVLSPGSSIRYISTEDAHRHRPGLAKHARRHIAPSIPDMVQHARRQIRYGHSTDAH
eukprot:868658-Rhodomonas_salina.1